ncbi:MAG: histidine kinase, partial [Bacteroidia bacterium]
WYRSYTGKIGYITHDSVFQLPDNPLINEFQAEGIMNSFAIDDSDNVILGKQNAKDISFLKIRPPYFAKNTSIIWKNTSKIFGTDIHMVSATDFVYSVKQGDRERNKYYVSIYNLPGGTIEDSVDLKKWAPFNRIMPVLDNRLELIIGSDLREYDLTKKSAAANYVTDDIITAYHDKQLFFVSGHHTGLIRLNEPEKEAGVWLSKNTVTSVVKDRRAGYWLGTIDNGLFYIPDVGFKIHSHINGKGDNIIWHLSQLNEKQYLAGFPDGNLKVVSMEGGRLVNAKDLDLRSMHAITTDAIRAYYRLSPHEIILCFINDCFLIDTEKRTARAMKPKGTRLYMAFKKVVKTKSRLCMMTYKEICFIDTTDYLIRNQNVVPSEDRITSIAYDSDADQLYIGGVHGLYKYNGGPAIRRDSRILDCSVENLEYAKGRLFVATKEKGLVIISAGGTETINEKKGLTGDVCKSVTIHGNDIWVLTNGGVSRISYKGYENYTIKNYPRSTFLFDGSIGNLCVSDSFLYFSGKENLYAFPYREDVTGGPFYIKSVSAGGRRIDLVRPAELDYNVGNITIAYEALFYTSTRKIEYRYRMRETDTTWNYTSETSVTFPSLAPGAYSVLVEAKAGNGLWIKSDKVILFRIGLPFWLKWWFIAGEVILLAGGVVLWIMISYNRKLKKEREKNRMQSKIHELEAKASKAQMNPHFIFNSLNSIQQFILGNDNDKAFSYLTRFSKLIRKLLESNRTGSLSLAAEVDILEKYLEIESMRFKGSFSYTVELEKGVVASSTLIPHMMIQPFIENAIWHGLLHKKDNRRLIVRFSYIDSQTLLCSIDDNGVGRGHAEEKQVKQDKESLGVNLIKERLHLFSKVKNAKYGIRFTDKKDEKGEPAGTTVEIKLPILS